MEDKEAVGIDYYIIVITPDIVMKCVSIILNQYNAQYKRQCIYGIFDLHMCPKGKLGPRRPIVHLIALLRMNFFLDDIKTKKGGSNLRASHLGQRLANVKSHLEKLKNQFGVHPAGKSACSRTSTFSSHLFNTFKTTF